jgi:hypothetical protein
MNTINALVSLIFLLCDADNAKISTDKKILCFDHHVNCFVTDDKVKITNDKIKYCQEQYLKKNSY